MAYLGMIIRHLEETLHVQVQGVFDASRSILGAAFLTERLDREHVFWPTTLYLCPFSELPKYKVDAPLLFVGGPSAPGELAPGQLAIAEPLPVTDVFNAIEDEILRYHTQKIKREEMFLALYSGNGIQGILNTAYTYLGNPITLCDTSFSAICFSPKFNDSLNLEYTNSRAFIKEIKIQNMRDNHIIDRLYGCVK